MPETKEVSRRLYDDAMYKLEHNLEDKKVAKTRANVLESAIELNDSLWKDDYTSNCALRSIFRVGFLILNKLSIFIEKCLLQIQIIYFTDEKERNTR